MHIQIVEHPRSGALAPSIFTWDLVKADGEIVVRGPRSFLDEAEARSQIAAAKKSMKGAGRCRVLSP